MRFFNHFRAHLLHNLLEADRSIRVAANSRKCVPHIGPREVNCGHAAPDLVVPADPGLCAGMPLHCAAQVPFKRPFVIAFDTKTHRVHDPYQFFRVRIACAGRWFQRIVGGVKGAAFHQVTCLFNVGKRRAGTKEQGEQKSHLGKTLCFIILLVPAQTWAEPWPAALTEKDFIAFDPDQAAVGQLLFYDKILSGNRNISCGTCHHPAFGSTDGLSLGIGEGGVGLGPDRSPGEGEDRIVKRVPRNAPGLWNLGAHGVETLMHDGRISVGNLYGTRFNTPAEEWLPSGLNSLLAAQALFPLTSETEMAGGSDENEVSGAVNDRIDKGWPIIAKRVRTIPAYGEMFVAAFDHIAAPEDVTIVEIANALAAFIGTEFRSTDSPFDQFLAGDMDALGALEKQGMALFYGRANCAGCHAGPLLSDHDFRALGLPPFGPGRTRRFDLIARDVGRLGESDRLEDAYRFRTPMLRNVALTAPYGHNGAYRTLPEMIAHHIDPLRSFDEWEPVSVDLPEASWLAVSDMIIRQDQAELQRQRAAISPPKLTVTDAEIALLVAFLEALTGSGEDGLMFGVPSKVPSGLPVDDVPR